MSLPPGNKEKSSAVPPGRIMSYCDAPRASLTHSAERYPVVSNMLMTIFIIIIC